MITAEIENLNEFNLKLSDFVKNVTTEQLTQTQRKMALQCLKGVVFKTPVDEGGAKANWIVTIGSPSTAITLDNDPSGGATIANGQAVIDQSPPYCIIWISNNKSYIDVLEHGLFEPPNPGPSKDKRDDRKGKILVAGGYSVQASRGMLAITVEELRAQFAST